MYFNGTIMPERRIHESAQCDCNGGCHYFIPVWSVRGAIRRDRPRVADFVKAGKIRAGLAEAPIISTKDPSTGELRGVAVDLSRELAARIEVELVQVPYPRPGAVMAGLKSNEWDIAFLGIDPARSAEGDFSPAYLEVDLRYLVPLNSWIHTMADADTTGTRIAVPRGDLVDVLLSKRLKQAELVRADTVVGAFELLQTGKADVCALPSKPNPVFRSSAGLTNFRRTLRRQPSRDCGAQRAWWASRLFQRIS